MMLRKRVAAFLAAILVFVMCAQMAMAAQARLTGVRFGASRSRIVFDLDRVPAYNVTAENGGRRIVLDLDGVRYDVKSVPRMKNGLVRSVDVGKKVGGVRVTVELNEPGSWRVRTLKSPLRLFIDLAPKGKLDDSLKADKPSGGAALPADTGKTHGEVSTEEQQEKDPWSAAPLGGRSIDEEPAPGLTYTRYVRDDARGKLTAYILTASRRLYTVQPALAKGQVPGLETVSGISDRYDAVAAVNSSYFAVTGELIGITKLSGMTVGTTYFTRTGAAMMPDGTIYFGQGSYSGTVTLGNVTWPVGGVDAERGDDSLVIYNRGFGTHTRTNEFGMEYVVRGGKVTAVHGSDTAIPEDGCVISVHGKAAKAFAGIKPGKSAVINEDFGEPWNSAIWIQGAGPRLVAGGVPHVTAQGEQFPSDISSGRAPRTAFGVTKSGDYIFVVADGRQESSIGCTLSELAELLAAYGAQDAMNFDGGGSSELVIGGEVKNHPSDGHERRVGCAMILKKR